MRLSIYFALLANLLLPGADLAADHPGPPPVAIHSASISAEDLAALLGAYVWKFDVSLPPDARQVNLNLQTANKGQAPSQFGSSISCPMEESSGREVLVAIVPIDGTISDAAQVRVTILAFGAVASSTADNPLKNLGIGKPQSPENSGNGVFNLIGGYSGSAIQSPVSTADVVVSLKIEAK